jgi:hypothetical protein
VTIGKKQAALGVDRFGLFYAAVVLWAFSGAILHPSLYSILSVLAAAAFLPAQILDRKFDTSWPSLLVATLFLALLSAGEFVANRNGFGIRSELSALLSVVAAVLTAWSIVKTLRRGTGGGPVARSRG